MAFINKLNDYYTQFFEIIPDQFIGSGIKLTNSYICKITKEEWAIKCAEFWETRTSGNPVIWEAIKQIISEQDEYIMYEILEKNELYLEQQTIQSVSDQLGNAYNLPTFVINEPTIFQIKQENDNLIQDFQEQELNINIRSTEYENDLSIYVKTTESVEELKQKLQNGAQAGNCRLFIKGREMKNDKKVGNYINEDGQIIQAFL